MLQEDHVNMPIADYLRSQGSIFKVFDRQDSGCVSYGLDTGGTGRLFVKTTSVPQAAEWMRNGASLNRQVRHPLLPKLLHVFTASDAYVTVFEWVDGDVLASPDYPGEEGRNRKDSPHYRFRQLPEERITDALTSVYELHVRLEEAGYVAEDFYDGAILYDFDRHRIHMCDLDHYRHGPFELDRERTYGSSRFMAPEEFVKGSLIDERTTVYNLGRAAFVFLGEGKNDPLSWRASRALHEVAAKAASANRAERYGRVRDFHAAWTEALRSGAIG